MLKPPRLSITQFHRVDVVWWKAGWPTQEWNATARWALVFVCFELLFSFFLLRLFGGFYGQHSLADMSTLRNLINLHASMHGAFLSFLPSCSSARSPEHLVARKRYIHTRGLYRISGDVNEWPGEPSEAPAWWHGNVINGLVKREYYIVSRWHFFKFYCYCFTVNGRDRDRGRTRKTLIKPGVEIWTASAAEVQSAGFTTERIKSGVVCYQNPSEIVLLSAV